MKKINKPPCFRRTYIQTSCLKAYESFGDFKAWAVGYYTLQGNDLYAGDPKKEVWLKGDKKTC